MPRGIYKRKNKTHTKSVRPATTAPSRVVWTSAYVTIKHEAANLAIGATFAAPKDEVRRWAAEEGLRLMAFAFDGCFAYHYE